MKWQVLCSGISTEDRFPEMAGRFRLIVLMAAAVPKYMVEHYTGHLSPIRLSGKRVFGLHSSNDLVLRAAFPVGQTAAGEGFFPTAIGLKGNPKSFWTAGDENTDLNHDEYWQNRRNSTIFSQQIGQATRRLLPDRKITARRQASYWLNKFG